MLITFTPDTNDVGKLKVLINELKVVLVCLAHEKDISERKTLKKVEESTEEVKELRSEVTEKHVEEKNKAEEEGKDVEELEEKDEGEKDGKEENMKREKKR